MVIHESIYETNDFLQILKSICSPLAIKNEFFGNLKTNWRGIRNKNNIIRLEKLCLEFPSVKINAKLFTACLFAVIILLVKCWRDKSVQPSCLPMRNSDVSG